MNLDFTVSDQAISKIMADQNVGHAKASQIARDLYGKDIDDLKQFWENPYVHGDRGWAEWLTEFAWQHFTFDGVPVYPRYNLGGKVMGFEIIDSPTIKPLLDNRGDIPHPPAVPRPAATVLLLRDGPEGIEVFMATRHQGSSFMPGVLVFPGGGVDPDDAAPGLIDGGPLHDDAISRIAGVREIFEEAAFLLARPAAGGDLVGADRLEKIVADHRAVNEVPFPSHQDPVQQGAQRRRS
jgi:8-oxo-dGTP pyrophosphatase MutT (NUDIX family)